VYTKGRTLPDIQSGLPFVMRWMMPLLSRRFLRAGIGHGIGRHTEAEVYEMGIKDLKAISIHLGNRPFFTGEKATEVDCAMFGLLAQFLWNSNDGPLEKIVKDELPNLKAFCERMKKHFWPDWNRCLNPPRIT
jgi:glutathione S-transferase